MSAGIDKAVNVATRVGAAATRSRYDGLSIALHWATTILVFALFGLALIWDDMSRPVRQQLIGLHLTLGILLTATLAWRLAWRLTKVSHSVTEQLEEVHDWIAWAIVILALGHAAAALFHHFVLRDEVLVRMLPRGRKRAPAAS